jgi:hypothetical protein
MEPRGCEFMGEWWTKSRKFTIISFFSMYLCPCFISKAFFWAQFSTISHRKNLFFACSEWQLYKYCYHLFVFLPYDCCGLPKSSFCRHFEVLDACFRIFPAFRVVFKVWLLRQLPLRNKHLPHSNLVFVPDKKPCWWQLRQKDEKLFRL